MEAGLHHFHLTSHEATPLLRRVRVLLLLCLSASGCLLLLPPDPVMTSVRDELKGGKAKCLVVFLPGVRDEAEDFDEKGFVAALREKNLSVDVISAQATMPYYTQGVLVERLGNDVIEPAQAKRYRQTWLIGVSMGGMGALLYSHAHSDEVTGVLALAPYLGKRSITKEIRAAGGLASWQAPAKPEKIDVMDDGVYQRELWRWLQALTAGKEKGPELYLGWGQEDPWLAESCELLGEALPESRRYTVPGGHKWTSWKKVLDQFLNDSRFAKSCAR